MSESQQPPSPPRAARRVPTSADFRSDTLLAVALLIGGLLSAWLTSVAGFYGDEHAPFGWGVIFAIVVTAPLALRRRFPSLVAIVVCASYFVAVTLRIPEIYVSNIAMFIAIYTVGAWVDNRPRALLVRSILIFLMFVWLLVSTLQDATAPTTEGLSRVGAFSPYVAFMLIQFFINALYFGGAYYFGDRAYAAARERSQLEERTAQLERERAVTAQQAVALDRLRIARELHDVVAHHVSAMGVQAGAARAVLDADPDASRRALSGIETSARAALQELRQLLGTLRAADDPAGEGAEDAASTVRLAGLPDLVEHAAEAGLPTTLDEIGEPWSVPDVVQVNLYRIVQEALTNARRHGGPDARADVRVRYSPDAVEIEVTNTGRTPVNSGGGLGLVGMRERASASGGTIDVGPRTRGGYLVRVRVPRPRTEVLS